jgi:D-amino-acid dehydrogenase
VLPRLTPHPTRSIYLIERKVAVNPHADALRISGTLELVKNDFSINQRRVDVIMRGARGMLAIPNNRRSRNCGADCGRAHLTGCR